MIAAVIGALVLAVQTAGPTDAAATPPAAPGPAKAVKPKDDSQKRICKTEAVVGSLIPKRVCGTKADWDALTEDGQAATQNVQTRALVKPTREMGLAH